MRVVQVQPWLGEEEATIVGEVVRGNWITEGPRTEAFDLALRELTGSTYGVFAPNGTLALFLGLLALGIGPGDEVLVPDITFIASANAILLAGASPVFVDVNERNYQIDVSRCKVTVATRAIMPVHLYGMAANMLEVMRFAQRHRLFVIEDAAQAVGVTYRGQHAGTFGDVGCFSFFADKTITTGEGGYVACKSGAVYRRLKALRNQGRPDRGTFVHPEIGYNFRITDLQAAIGLVQLGKLHEIVGRKQVVLGWYRQQLENIGGVRFLEVEEGSTYVPFRVVLICERAHELKGFLARHEIQTRSFFYPLHRQPCFEYMGLADEDFPNATYGYEHGLCLPVFPELEKAAVDYICSHIREFYR